MKSYRGTWAEIDLDRIIRNVSQIKTYSGFNHMFAVVKANAYGHGDIEVARTALEAGATHLAVSMLDEAIRLRGTFRHETILVMGPVRVENIAVAAEHRITLTASDIRWIEQAADYAGPPIDIHIKLDTGMNRVGIKQRDQFIRACELLREHPVFNLKRLIAHFSTADCDANYYSEQQKHFDAITGGTDFNSFELIHQSNSAAMLRHQKHSRCNSGRLGLAMYGLPPSDQLSIPFELQQAFSLHTRISQVKALKKGEKVGYGPTYEASEDQLIAILQIGYADGWLRYHQNRNVVINNKPYPIVGRICMDQCMVRIDESIKVGDHVTLLGDLVTVTDAANDLKTINYEIVCSISDRVPRIYKRNGKIVSLRNDRFDNQGY